MLVQEFGCWIEAAVEGHGWEEALERSAVALRARCTGLARRVGPGFVVTTSGEASSAFVAACLQSANDRRAPITGEIPFDYRANLIWSRVCGEIGEGECLGVFFAVLERPADRAAFEAIAAVVRTAVNAHARIARLVSASALKDIALDQSPSGAAIVDATLAVHEMNEAFAAIVTRADGLSLRGGRMVCRRSEDQTALALAISAANQSPSSADAIVCIQRTNGAQPYVARPLGPKSASESSDRCLLMIVDPDQGPRTAEEIWRAMFDLTECELIIAQGLVSGRRINDIAHQRGVSVETVRAQTKRMFERLHVSSQTQAAVVLTKSAPFRTQPQTRCTAMHARKEMSA